MRADALVGALGGPRWTVDDLHVHGGLVVEPRVEVALPFFSPTPAGTPGRPGRATAPCTSSAAPRSPSPPRRTNARTGDPRPSVREGYRDADDYVARIRAAAEDLVARRLLLAEDVERAVAPAADWSAPRHRFGLP
ncbi:alpha/beta hydrolase domain-containing protein [Streptomyces sp. YKOK-I1]